MTFISTFTRDEPLEAFLEAARAVGNVRFYVTGRLKDANPEILKRAPVNVTFTGFLERFRVRCVAVGLGCNDLSDD